MSRALDELVALLDLEELERNLFRGRSPDESGQRVFGGQVAGQALVAACRTVGAGVVHSLQAYFLRPGDPRVPIVYQVDRIRDGRSFTTRRVTAVQHGRAIFHLSASFQPEEPGLDHQIPMPEVAAPESLPTWSERVAPYLADAPPEMRRWLEGERGIDVRYVGDWHPLEPVVSPPLQQVWMRANGKLADDPALHACIVAYASDITLLDTALLPHGVGWADTGYLMASLDHAMWFHRPFRADEWLLYHQTSPTAAGARGFTRAEIYTRDGRLAVSVVQEGLIRRRRAEGAG
ncbi:MAG: acyl-CoA thioesterase II [Myxococcota bacterium]|nr:acyl-CoA thioesterase II [Myxococcota bacterium]